MTEEKTVSQAEKAELIATVILGWRHAGTVIPHWLDANYRYKTDDFNPFEDQPQALMVAEQLRREKRMNVALYLMADNQGAYRYEVQVDVHWAGSNDTLSAAISETAYLAAVEMQAKERE